MRGASIFAIGAWSGMLYAVVTLLLYVYLWSRWSILTSGEAEQILALIGQRRREWTTLWWAITVIPLALIPTFLAVRSAFQGREETLAGIAFVAGLVALILGIIGPLRSATTVDALARIYASGSEMQRESALVVYRSGESYGQGLFCLFGAT
jgi:hypothetical protein